MQSKDLTNLKKLEQTVATLRSPDGCPWDREQTHLSLTRHLIAECSELLEAIDREDLEHMREELGDVLLQVVLHAQIAREAGEFDLDEVAGAINAKLIRRHPHVFGDEETRRRLDTSEKVLVEWEKIKAAEKRENGQAPTGKKFKELPPMLPALLYAYEMCKQAEKHGVPMEDTVDRAAVRAKAESLDEENLGLELLEWVMAARSRGLDPEAALRRAASRWLERA